MINFSPRELTLFWSKLLKRLEPTEQSFLEKCQKMSSLAKTVFHLLFFIKVIQSEVSSSFSQPGRLSLKAYAHESTVALLKVNVIKAYSWFCFLICSWTRLDCQPALRCVYVPCEWSPAREPTRPPSAKPYHASCPPTWK